MYYAAGISSGCALVTLGGASVGQVDTYRSPAVANVLSAASTISVSASSTCALKIAVGAHNASSLDNVIQIEHIELRRIST